MLLSLFVWGWERPSLACASCGSGSGDPLILNPSERLKLYFATRYQSIPAQIQSDGVIAPNYLFDAQTFLDLGLGVRLSRSLFTSIYWGAQANYGREDKWGLQDPLIKTRWTLIEQKYNQPWLPQLQLLFGYKANFTSDKFESQDPQLLDVFGTGHQEFHIGYDLWNANLSMFDGNLPILAGLSQTLVLPVAREIEGVSERPSYSLGSVGTIGTYYHGANKILAGYFLNLKAERWEDDRYVEDSSSRNHALFVTADYAIDMQTSVRVTASFAGLGKSYNTTQSRVVTLSLNKTLF